MKSFIKKYHNYSWFLLIFFISFGAMVARGYSFGLGDQAIQLPLYNKLLNPSLFPNDDLFPVTYSQYTLLYWLIPFIVQTTHISLSSIFFTLYIIFNFLFFCGVNFFVSGITKSKTTLLFSLLMFVWHIPV